jgi:hypothetical protein
MEYKFQLGSFPKLSLAEIITVLQTEHISYQIRHITDAELHIDIDNINPVIFLQILGGTPSIEEVWSGKVYKQKIKDYQRREFKKPYVDPKSGLLTAKLAKMMINLSFTQKGVKRIYDPFCGGGTIITEGMVMGLNGIGSDIDKRTVFAARKNAAWIAETYKTSVETDFFVSDIFDIDSPSMKAKGIDAIVTEPFLGKPQRRPLKMHPDDTRNLDKVNKLIDVAVKKASGILETGQRMVVVIPQFRSVKGIQKLDISKNFNAFSFKKVNALESLDIDKTADLLYFRPKAVVLREICILEKI